MTISNLKNHSSAEYFLQKALSGCYNVVPTGIDVLDQRLSGGFLEKSLVIVSAAPGAGKTAFATQIIENIAKTGRKCVYLNFELSWEQLLARSIARMVGEEFDLSAIDVLRADRQPEDVKKAISDACRVFDENLFPNIFFSAEEVGRDLDQIVYFLEGRVTSEELQGNLPPIVCIDYLQLLQGADREDATSVTKRAINMLKDFAKNHNTVVICVSAQSRSANNDAGARQDAGRDTSNIEYSADVQIQLKVKKDDENIRELYITKSRFSESSLSNPINFRFFGRQGCLVPLDDPTVDRDANEHLYRRSHC